MKTVAIIQARMGSTRLPGKVLQEIGGETMLQRVVNRVRAAARVEHVCVATSVSDVDDVIAEHCKTTGVDVFRGSESDVLDRFARAAAHTRADVIVRVTSDCPLLDPEVIDDVVKLREDERRDYASNTGDTRTYPRGLDCEVMTRAALDAAAREAVDPAEREHVTLFLYRRPERFSIAALAATPGAAHHRWTVDTAEDLELVRQIVARLPARSTKWTDALSIVEREPALAALNQHVQQKSV